MIRRRLLFQLGAAVLPTALVFINCATSVVAQEAADQSTTKPPLQGGVSHDVSLPGLPAKYHTGSQFDPANLQALTPGNVWIAIPNWYAGKWHSETRTVEYAEDCKTGVHDSSPRVFKEVAEVVQGHQRDKTGQIWHFIKVPRWQTAEANDGKAYMHAVREDVLQCDSDQIVLKILNNQMTVDPEKQTIISSNQVQQIGTYIPVEDGLVKFEASLKNFDQDGNPIVFERCSKLMKRIAPYEDINNLDGLDLKKLFAEYLKKIGREDLLPTSPK